jgi:hypothetical protein
MRIVCLHGSFVLNPLILYLKRWSFR